MLARAPFYLLLQFQVGPGLFINKTINIPIPYHLASISSVYPFVESAKADKEIHNSKLQNPFINKFYVV